MKKRQILALLILSALIIISAYYLIIPSLTGKAVTTQVTGTTKTYIYAGTLAASKSSKSPSETQYYIQDHLGSNRKVLENGDVEQADDTYAFGEERNSFGEGNNYKFTGKPLDDETGLYYYGARYYSPELGRFIQADALKGSPEDPSSLNRYSYVKNNPLKYVDPSGNAILGGEEDANYFLGIVNNILGKEVFGMESKWYELRYRIVEKTDSYEGSPEQGELYQLVKKLVNSDMIKVYINLDPEMYEFSRITNMNELLYDKKGNVEKSYITLIGEDYYAGDLTRDFDAYTMTPAAALFHELGHAGGENDVGAIRYENLVNQVEKDNGQERFWYRTKTYVLEESGRKILIGKGILPSQQAYLNERDRGKDDSYNRISNSWDGAIWDTIPLPDEEVPDY